ncbi:MAG: hypothetical protein ABSH22_19900 [Tepidisphaeraceae bacterium]|jgi:hypothetical protein
MLADGDIAEVNPPEGGVITYSIQQNDDDWGEKVVLWVGGTLAVGIAAGFLGPLLLDSLVGLGVAALLV